MYPEQYCSLSSQTNDPYFDKLWAEIDPNETGYVPFEAFLSFMTKEMVDQDTADQVLNSFKILAGDKVWGDFLLHVQVVDALGCSHSLPHYLPPSLPPSPSSLPPSLAIHHCR